MRQGLIEITHIEMTSRNLSVLCYVSPHLFQGTAEGALRIYVNLVQIDKDMLFVGAEGFGKTGKGIEDFQLAVTQVADQG
jgi:hypothetical protein